MVRRLLVNYLRLNIPTVTFFYNTMYSSHYCLQQTAFHTGTQRHIRDGGARQVRRPDCRLLCHQRRRCAAQFSLGHHQTQHGVGRQWTYSRNSTGEHQG